MAEPTENPDYKTVDILMSEVFSDEEFNCRGKIIPLDVVDLIKSIERDGLQQPIILQPFTGVPGKKYRVIAGHRRHMAYHVMKKLTIPAMIREGLNELQARTINLVENLKRQNLNILQESRALIPYKKANWGQDIIAAEVGMSRGWVQVRIMLLDLPEDVQAEASAGLINQDQVRKLWSLRGNKDELYKAVRLIKDRRRAGETGKIDVQVKKPVNPHKKQHRAPAEIFALQEIVQGAIGNSLVTQMMGWCAGLLSDYEIHRAIKETAALMGKRYEIPIEIIAKL